MGVVQQLDDLLKELIVIENRLRESSNFRAETLVTLGRSRSQVEAAKMIWAERLKAGPQYHSDPSAKL